MMARSVFLLGFAVALVTAFGCSSGGDGGMTPPALACSDDGPAAPNAVTLICGGSIDSATQQVDAVMGGPGVGTTTLRGFNFDVTYDPSKLEFASAGNANELFPPSALVLGTLFNGLQGRVVVSIQQVGGDPDVVVGAGGQHVVLNLSFRRVAETTFGPMQLLFDHAEATTASTTIRFLNGLSLSYP